MRTVSAGVMTSAGGVSACTVSNDSDAPRKFAKLRVPVAEKTAWTRGEYRAG